MLKQFDVSFNTKEEIAAFDLAFPLFRQLDEEIFFPEGWTSVDMGLGSRAVFVGRGRERRYAGDRTLGRGNYWSVCTDSDGFDGFTFINELRAYHSYMSRCEVHAFDSSCDREALKQLHEQEVFDLAIVLSLAEKQFGSLDDPFLLMLIRPVEFGDNADQAGLLEGRVHLFLYHLRVEEQSIARLFDLRRAACRRWLLEEFLPFEFAHGEIRRKNANVELIGGRAPTTVEDLLPILLSPEIGGSNPFIQALGSWLRCQECDGIVFPSSRTDFFANENKGGLDSFSGWCLVDFRGSPPAAWQEHIGHIKSFKTYLGDSFKLTCRDKRYSASIRSNGLQKQNMGRFNTMAHHATNGTDPSLLDFGHGFVSVLDISRETLAKAE